MKLELVGRPDPRDPAYEKLMGECEEAMTHLYSLVPGYEVTLILRNATPVEGADVVLSNGTDMRLALNLLVTYHNRLNTPPQQADNRSH